MRLLRSKPCLALPVNNAAQPIRVTFSAGGDEKWSLDCRLDFETPKYTLYPDFSRYFGDSEEINIEVSPDFEFEASARPAPKYDLPCRPQLRFSPAYGWNNDPNGLCWFAGQYHMFFQHNPAGSTWGNMHWGHAVSSDLIRWKETDIALYPDADDHTIFSGSAVVDERNVSGLGEEGKPALLLFYTAAGDPFEQRLAYTLDGVTFRRCEGAVVPHIADANRDPKVVWCEELGKYVMALYLTEHTFRLLSSGDLLEWETVQDLELPGDSECPDFYPLTADDGQRRWVFMAASAHYYVGVIKNGRYEPTQGWRTMQPCGTGTIGYAAQTFFNDPRGRRVRISWIRRGTPEDAPFSQNMSLPHELKLISEPSGGYHVAAMPVSELALLTTDRGPGLRADFDVRAARDASVTLRGTTIPLPEGSYRCTVVLDGTSWERYIPSLGDVTAGEIAAPESRPDRRRSGRRQPDQIRVYTAREPGGVTFANAEPEAYGEKALESIWA
ncbi:MAG: glycoside hydrolase family 32 protein [Clostridiales bacterium]|nr:glycoside hydrolase family 32 protein [Clostridiales bacterium]